MIYFLPFLNIEAPSVSQRQLKRQHYVSIPVFGFLSFFFGYFLDLISSARQIQMYKLDATRKLTL